ncbi:MAG: hypothetical protein BWY72_02413 [Bacteroidetes bacterium ADurb.Bin416]|nr:MAG: hypothetical protein BWY72_02413 [Bacteroidetes bacterium ADurb.Bin416]
MESDLVMALVKYRVLPSLVKQPAPSSNSELMGASM